ncbi:MAG: helicase-related protein [Pseudonocardiaceae bacterium]
MLTGSYHGALRRAERDEVQDAFMGGELRLVVATNAFGMGIDKPDVRFVLHADDSPSVDAYHQEAGRAGRDGKPRRPSFTTAHKTWRWAPRTLPAPSTRCRATRSTR